VLFQVKRGTIYQLTVVHFDFCLISNTFSCCYACTTLEHLVDFNASLLESPFVLMKACC